MFSNDKRFFYHLIIHCLLAYGVFIFKPLSPLIAMAVLIAGTVWIYQTKDRNHEVLMACAYVVGIEIFLRITGGNFIYEYGKYGILIFLCQGMLYKGFSRDAMPYWFYILLLLPGVIYSLNSIDLDETFRKSIVFNILGPATLGFAALYTYRRAISLEQIHRLLYYMGLPIVSSAVYLYLYTPSVQEVVLGTGSNFATSGGFGPNQVATIMGLGVFIFVSRIFFRSPTKFMLLLNILMTLLIGYRGLVTFSRGGMLTGGIMILALVWFVFFKVKPESRRKLRMIVGVIALVSICIWSYTLIQTKGLIGNRYAGEDALGRKKESQFTGREDIAQSEINYFLENPIMGIGVAVGARTRQEEKGVIIMTHNEITRTIAEHGSLGILALLILFWMPLILYFDNKYHIYLLCFFLFWLLTINHSAMRLAAPGFIYALTLLRVLPVNSEQPKIQRDGHRYT